MSNNRTGPDYQDYQRKKQRAAQKRRVAERNKEQHDKYQKQQMAPDKLKKALKGPASASLSLGYNLGKKLRKRKEKKHG